MDENQNPFDLIPQFKKRKHVLFGFSWKLFRAAWAYHVAEKRTRKATKATRRAIRAGHRADDLAMKAMNSFCTSNATPDAVPTTSEMPHAVASPAVTLPGIAISESWARHFQMVNDEIAQEIAAELQG